MQRTILLVDDEKRIVQLFKSYLEHSDFHVLVADNALSAVEVTLRHDIDALITDMRMPGVNGQELLECLREKRPDLPAIIVSGYISECTLVIDDLTKIFSKPVALSLMVKCLNTMLSLKKSVIGIKDSA